MPWLAPLISLGVGLAGAAMSSGNKPKVPAFNKTDASLEQNLALQNNMANLPQAEQLSEATNFYNQNELDRMLQEAIPGYHSKVAAGSANVDSFLHGELPPDVAAQIKRNTAEKALGGGYGGSGMARNLTSRDLGLTSLDLTKFGTQLAPQWMASQKALAVPKAFDPASMFLTPAERIGNTQQNNQGQFNRDLYQAQVSAAPDPFMANIGGILSKLGGAGLDYGANSWLNGGDYGGRGFTPSMISNGTSLLG